MDNAYALVVGIADYRQVAQLPATVRKDAQDVRDILVSPQHCGYPDGNVKLLLDGEATRGGILAALSDLATRTGPTSGLLIYFSSHGVRLVSGSYAGEYLLPTDVILTTDEDLALTAISGAEFAEALRVIPARKVLAIFDCCHSGGIGQLKAPRVSSIKAGLPDGYYEKLATGRGRAILSSSRESESSYILPAATNSLFTHHLLAELPPGSRRHRL